MHSHDLTLGLAFGLGALHALEPGHGKTAMLVYLSGERKSFLHPLVMGIASGVSHSVSLLGIAAAVHLTHHLTTSDHHHQDESTTLAMQWVSAILVILVGLWMVWVAWRSDSKTECTCGSTHPDNANTAHADEAHADGAMKGPSRASYSVSALLGAAFGLLPCPSAMAAYFTSMSTGAPVAAYLVIGLFAAGIASSITLVGMMIQIFGGRLSDTNRFAQLPWPWIRAVLILSLGVFYLVRTAVQ